MPDNNQRPAKSLTPSLPSAFSLGPEASVGAGPAARPEAPPKELSEKGNQDLIAALKTRLEETRLPANLREEILAELPPPEARERLYRELQEKGGLASDEFIAALDLGAERQP